MKAMRRSFIFGVLSFLLGAAALSQGQVISTLAGTGSPAFSGDGGPANKAAVNTPFGVAVDNNGIVYISDYANNRIRKIDSSGVISTVAGCGEFTTACILAGIGDGGPAIAPLFLSPWDIVVDNAGSFYFTDSGNARIRKVDPQGIITTVAGGGSKDLGENVLATSTTLGNPVGLAIDGSGNLYVAEVDNNRVRKVSTSGNIVTIAGNGKQGFSGDGGSATNAMLNNPHGVGVDAAGNVYVVDTNNYRIRKVDTSGMINTVAGNGQVSNTKDGVPATSVALTAPWDVKLDAAGNLFISEWLGYRIRKVDTQGIITTVAGTGNPGFSGDGGAATSANLQAPTGIALDAAGAIYIADSIGNRIRKVGAAPAFQCTNTTAPTITSIDSASAYGGYPYFASGSWLEIKGTNLADPSDPRLRASTNPGQWTASDFSGANAPTLLDGIKVSINGDPAYVWYLSPGQINVQAPENSTIGNVSITVTNCNATSSPFTFARRALAPGLLAPSSFNIGGTQYMAATFASDGAYVLNTSAGAALGINSRPAKPGDAILAYGIGFGDVTPSILPGAIVGRANTLINPATISFGTTSAFVSYSGLAGNFVGLYEFYITVPVSLANGDYQINVLQNGTSVPQTIYLSVHN
jgi:uncharacterized protein (TIGR03437 family)